MYTINEKKTVSKYFNRIQLNKNVEKRKENMWETNCKIRKYLPNRI